MLGPDVDLARAPRPLGKVVFVATRVLLLAVVSVSAAGACLGSLPEATICPPATVFASCPWESIVGPSGTNNTADPTPTATAGTPTATAPQPVPLPVPSNAPILPLEPKQPSTCALDSFPCLQQQHRVCACAAEGECRPSAATCSPPPDCPKSVQNVAAGASCLATTASLAIDPTTGPPCMCGCASCATTCDGQGPVLGLGQVLTFNLPGNLPASGRLRVMARIRGGSNDTVLSVQSLDGPETAIGVVPTANDFVELFPHAIGSEAPEYGWSGDRLRPVAVRLHAGSDGAIEVDCIVPFLVP